MKGLGHDPRWGGSAASPATTASATSAQRPAAQAATGRPAGRQYDPVAIDATRVTAQELLGAAMDALGRPKDVSGDAANLLRKTQGIVDQYGGIPVVDTGAGQVVLSHNLYAKGADGRYAPIAPEGGFSALAADDDPAVARAIGVLAAHNQAKLLNGMTMEAAIDSLVPQFGSRRGVLDAIAAANGINRTAFAQQADRTAQVINAIHTHPELQKMAGLTPVSAAGAGAADAAAAAAPDYWGSTTSKTADLPIIGSALADWTRRDLALAAGGTAAGLGGAGLFLANYLANRGEQQVDPAAYAAMAQANSRY